jgi:hypothetical protein
MGGRISALGHAGQTRRLAEDAQPTDLATRSTSPKPFWRIRAGERATQHERVSRGDSWAVAQIEENIARYLADMDTADRAEPAIAEAKTSRLRDKIAVLKQQMQQLKELEVRMLAAAGPTDLTDGS